MPTLALIGLPLGFHDWLPAAQAVTLGLLTFVQEDVPTVSAALLASAGTLAWEVGLIGCFLGIWIGDALLYLLARGVGRPLIQRSWAKHWFDPAAIARSEQWFAKKGPWLLLSSRFVPGTRLPTYLAAGFLHLPFGRFLFVTGSAVALWTAGIFLLARLVGPNLLPWLQQWNLGGLAIVLTMIGVVAAVRILGHVARPSFRRRVSAALGRWTRWEFWPAWLFYVPVFLHYLCLALRYRSFTLPTAANPGIFSGGIVGESKIATLRNLSATSPEFTAEAHLIEGAMLSARLESLERLRRQHRIDLPFILKPDMGQRGAGVKLIRTSAQAEDYLRKTNAPLLLQRYAPGPLEVGVLYYRFPHQSRGSIFAITEKIFPTVTGDGQHTLEELVWRGDRSKFLAETYLRRLPHRRTEVLPEGESLRLVEAGNHAQGCIFQDGARLWSEPLERRIDEISQKLDGFFIGRYDIRYASEEDLRSGRNFQIVELNGAASEATNIYDARHSLWEAYATLFRQWALVFAIGAANRVRGWQTLSLARLWRAWRANAALASTYPLAD